VTAQLRMRQTPALEPLEVVVVGKENVGKTQLVSAMTGAVARPSNFRGATIACEWYATEDVEFVDTPGIMRHSDTETTRAALDMLGQSDTVLVVVQATHLNDDLDDLLPLVHLKRGVVVITHWDRLADRADEANRAVEKMRETAGVPIVAVNACKLSAAQRAQLLEALRNPGLFDRESFKSRSAWRRVEPAKTPLEMPVIGQILGLLLIIAPAVAAVWGANHFAELVDPYVQSALGQVVARLSSLPALPREILVGPYGFITMGPLLFVWAVPTVVVFSFGLGIYKASGLLDRMVVAIDPLTRPFGISGRDVIRIVMGYGCNVPAVISTRACSSCSRGTCISAIAFGSACSYQMGATLAVFAAVGRPGLVVPYLLYLLTVLLIYTRIISPKRARSKLNVLMTDGRTFLVVPRFSWVWREARLILAQFFMRALPIFFLITLIASVLAYLDVFHAIAGALGPVLGVFNLPSDSALAVIMASIRKDGIVLLAEPGVSATMTAAQVLTAVYLAGVLLPCIVTVLTIAREQSVKFAAAVVGKQVIVAAASAAILGWGASLFL